MSRRGAVVMVMPDADAVLVVAADQDAAGHERLALAVGMLATGAGLERAARETGLGERELVGLLLELSFGLTATARRLAEAE